MRMALIHSVPSGSMANARRSRLGDPLLAIAARYDLQVIEDATEALGAEYRGNAFTCEPAHNLVHRELLSGEGPALTSRRAEDIR